MRPAAPLAVRYLNHHHHNILTRHLPRLDPALQMVQVVLIATHIREIGVEMRQDREAKAQSRKGYEEKGVLDLLGTNLTYLLCLG